MKRYRAALLTLILFAGIFPATAQTSKSDPTDVQGWFGAGFKLDLPKKWTTSLDYQSRFYNNVKTYNGSYISLGVAKKVIPLLELQGEYRLALVQKGVYHRVSIGAELNKGLRKFDFSLRLLFQNQLQDFDDTAKLNDKSNYWRARFGVKYRFLKIFDLYASVEPIMKFSGRYFVDNWRNTIGIKAKILPGTKIDLYYIYRPDYAKSYNRTFHVMGLNVDYTLKVGKRKGGKKKK